MLDALRNSPHLLSVKEVAAALGFHPQTIYAATRAGRFPHLRVGGRLKFDGAAVAAFLEERQVDPIER